MKENVFKTELNCKFYRNNIYLSQTSQHFFTDRNINEKRCQRNELNEIKK